MWVIALSGLNAYYYGQNKVNSIYTRWSQIETMHFDIYFPSGQDNFGKLAALMAEDTYYYLKKDFKFPAAGRIPIIFYSSQMEFQTTNIIYPLLPEGVGGFTESLRNRVAVPFDGDYAKLEKILTHELTHAYTNALDTSGAGSFFSLRSTNVPFWLTEGMPEYQASGGTDVNNNAFILDLVLNDKLRSLAESYGYSAYRLGEAFLDFLYKRYGREKVMDFFFALRAVNDTDKATRKVFGLKFKDLESRWRNQLKRDYYPFIGNHTIPSEYSEQKTFHREDGSYFNLAPRFSPDGQKYVYFSNRDGRFSIWSGGIFDSSKNVKIITGEATGSMEEFHYLRSALAWFPDSKRFAYVAKTSSGDNIYIADYEKRDIIRQISIPQIRVIYELDISPDGESCVFSGQKDMQADLFQYIFKTGELRQLNNDAYFDAEPRFSPDGNTVAFSSKRNSSNEEFRKGYFSGLHSDIFTFRLSDNALSQITFDGFNSYYPSWDSTGTKIVFISEKDSVPNLEVIDLETNSRATVTKTLSSIYSFDFNASDSYLVYSCYFDNGWDIFLKTKPMQDLDFVSYFSPQEIEPRDDLLSKVDMSRLDYFGKRKLKKHMFGRGPVMHNPATGDLDFMPKPDSMMFKIDNSWDNAPDSISVIPEVRLYKVKMKLDRLWGGFAYSSTVGTIGSLELGMSDIMGNHALGISLGIAGKIKDSNILLSYLYLPKRTDYGIGLYNILDEVGYRIYQLGNDDYYRYRQRETGIYLLTRYPVSKFLRLDFENQVYNWEYHWDTWEWNPTGLDGNWHEDNLLGAEVEAKKDFIYAPALSLTHDNTLYGPTGPVLGLRSYITLRKSFALHKYDYHTAYMDLRSYTLFSKRYSLAFRLVGGASGGKQPQSFGLNGYYGVRGYDNDQAGKKIAMATAELRFPFMDYMSVAFPLPLVLSSVRGSVFADAGSVWDDNDTYRGMQDGKLRDVKFGFGYGPRMDIGIAVLKLDFAWLTDFVSISKPTYYLSLTEDF
jgi:hypothetical protein